MSRCVMGYAQFCFGADFVAPDADLEELRTALVKRGLTGDMHAYISADDVELSAEERKQFMADRMQADIDAYDADLADQDYDAALARVAGE